MKLREILTLATFLTAGATVAFATPTCLNGDTLANYITLGAGGCEIGDAIYSSFSYTPTGSDPAAGQVDIGLDNNIGIFQTGLQFQTSGGLVWSSGFTLDYTVTLDQAACAAEYGAGSTCAITQAQMSFQGALAPNNAAMSAVLTAGGTININDLTTNSNAGQIAFAGVTLQATAITGTAGTLYPIDSFGLDRYQTVTPSVPEPASLGLIGGGLFVLGLLRKKISR